MCKGKDLPKRRQTPIDEDLSHGIGCQNITPSPCWSIIKDILPITKLYPGHDVLGTPQKPPLIKIGYRSYQGLPLVSNSLGHQGNIHYKTSSVHERRGLLIPCVPSRHITHLHQAWRVNVHRMVTKTSQVLHLTKITRTQQPKHSSSKA